MTGNEIIARARTVATQMTTDANQSPLIDRRAALRSLLNTCIRETYRQKAKNQDFIKDINVRNAITITAGAGTLPTTAMRQFLRQADWQDSHNSLISYFDYPIDSNSGQNFTQLGYVAVTGDTITYTAPSPYAPYTGTLYCTIPSFPVFPASMASDIPMTVEVSEDVITLLALAIRGQIKFDLTGSIT